MHRSLWRMVLNLSKLGRRFSNNEVYVSMCATGEPASEYISTKRNFTTPYQISLLLRLMHSHSGFLQCHYSERSLCVICGSNPEKPSQQDWPHASDLWFWHEKIIWNPNYISVRQEFNHSHQHHESTNVYKNSTPKSHYFLYKDRKQIQFRKKIRCWSCWI